jgi:hypothetical protein
MNRGESATGNVPPHLKARVKERSLAWQKKFWFYTDIAMIGLLIVSISLTSYFAYQAGLAGGEGHYVSMMWCFVMLTTLSFCYLMIRFFDNQYLASKRIVIKL